MMKASNLKSSGLSVLTSEAVDADGLHCSECGDTGPGDKLLIFCTRIGTRVRMHGGRFCSKVCHDRYHGLAPQTPRGTL